MVEKTKKTKKPKAVPIKALVNENDQAHKKLMVAHEELKSEQEKNAENEDDEKTSVNQKVVVPGKEPESEVKVDYAASQEGPIVQEENYDPCVITFAFNSSTKPTSEQIHKGFQAQVNKDRPGQSVEYLEGCTSWINLLKSFSSNGAIGSKSVEGMVDCSKSSVLKTFDKLINSRRIVQRVRILYNGNGIVSTKMSQKEKTQCGAFACADNEMIYVEDFLELIEIRAQKQERRILVHIFADCPGAGGVYHRVSNFAHQGKIDMKFIECVIVRVPCEFDEVSFGNSHGGYFTQMLLDDTYRTHVEKDNCVASIAEKIGDLTIGMLLLKNGGQGKHKVFRKIAENFQENQKHSDKHH